MSAWLHLRKDIMQEFYEQALLGRSVGYRWEAAVAAYADNMAAVRKGGRQQERGSKFNFKLKVQRRARRKQIVKLLNLRCLRCGSELSVNFAGHLKQKYCSASCRTAARVQAISERRAAARNVERRCTECGVSIVGMDPKTKVCSRVCYRKAHRVEGRAYTKAYRDRQKQIATPSPSDAEKK